MEPARRDVQRILIQIELINDPESLREIGQAAAKQLKTLGVNARWGKPKEKRSVRKIFVLAWAFGMLALLCSIPVWLIPPLFGGVSLFAVPFDQWSTIGIGTLGTICILQVLVLVAVYYLVRGISWIYDRARQEAIEDRRVAYERAERG
jgi:membrane-anchored glycerophosphoryl diester phosphodiesterase (GDPDase)